MKNLSTKIILIIITLAALVALISAAKAQYMTEQTDSPLETFSVQFAPGAPGANTKVSARVISYTFDVNRAQIAWIIKGKVVGSGKIFSFTTGDLGTQTDLTVSIITEDEKALGKSFVFGSAEVDLLWETAGYAPPFYRGKILAGPQSKIRITALPWGFGITDPKKLIYEWGRNGDKIPASSGPNKQIFDFYAASEGEELIEVAISTSDKSAVAQKSVHVKINKPKILFYEERPLEGTRYQKELGEAITLENPEFTIRAEPYFFSKRALPLLSYEWTMNNKKIETPQKPNLLNLSIPSGAKGTAGIIELSLFNPKNILERAEKLLQININL
jgi:hypothetical protein